MLFNSIKIAFCVTLLGLSQIRGQKPADFVDLSATVPQLVVSLRYGTHKNFMGRVVQGYENPIPLGTKALAEGLQCVQMELAKKGLGLILYDSYRPQKAVDDFVVWSSQEKDTLMKSLYYPQQLKSELFALGFIASQSGHSRGSTIDVGLVQWTEKGEYELVDMGSPWDFFGPEATINYTFLSAEQRNNRMKLYKPMLACGFKPYAKEWWHFTLKNEPYPDTYFNFDLTP